MSVLFTRRGTPPVLGKLASDYTVGDSIFLTVNGEDREFIIVQQGNPDASKYDNSCDGMWLLMKDLYTPMKWNVDGSNDYKSSTVHKYLNNEFLALLSEDVRNQISQVKIPYVNGMGSSGSVRNGSNGLSTKVFLLSCYELYYTASSVTPNLGTALDYFKQYTSTALEKKRIAYLNGTATSWWTRSPDMGTEYQAWYVSQDGGCPITYCTDTLALRPTLILPSSTKFNPDTNTIL